MTGHTDVPDDRRLIDVEMLVEELRRFAEARDWDQFHSPKKPVNGVSRRSRGAAGSLSVAHRGRVPRAAGGARAAAALEITDAVIYAVRLADVLGIDVNAAVTAKLRLNAERYPADRVRGSASKYTDSGERT